MPVKSIVKKAVLASAVTAAAISFSMAARAGESEQPGAAGKQACAGKEKCLGVVKAGKNDCASAKGATCAAHSCGGHATKDAAANEWVYVPAGLCDKLAGGKVAG